MKAQKIVTAETNQQQKSQFSDFQKSVQSMNPRKNSYFLTRIILVRFLAFIYAVAFLVAFNQNEQLLGKNGLLPANKYMDRIFSDFKAKSNPFKGLLDDRLWKKIHLYIYLPTLFWFSDWTNHINQILNYSALIGLTLALIIVIRGSANSIILLIMWLLYHSIVNIGQTWYSFGWESQVLESGFIAIFLVPFISLKKVDIRSPPSLITIYLYRWLIFRIMIGAGLIKLRGDKCWKDLTCMNYFYETQPVPNPVSFYLHKEPEGMHKFEVLSNHFIELIAPFLVLMPIRILRLVGGWIQIIFQIILIMSGNLSFLNWLTILPSLACFDDFHLKFFFSRNQDSPLWNLLKDQYLDNVKTESLVLKRIAIEKKVKSTINLMVLTLVAYLSIPVVLNLVSEKQAMNTSFEPFRIVNTYGAFGSVTKERYEVIFKGTNEKNLLSDRVEWFEYEFMCKPGNVNRTPCLISPYHYRLDWLMWFAAFQTYEYNPWLLSMTAKFLLNDKNFTSQMIAFNPFENKEPPKFVKADLYRYKFSPMDAKSWWSRKYVKSYIPAVSIRNLQEYIKELGWNSI